MPHSHGIVWLLPYLVTQSKFLNLYQIVTLPKFWLVRVAALENSRHSLWSKSILRDFPQTGGNGTEF